MTYKEISEIFGIPQTTLNDWRKSKGWRKTLFELFRAMDKEEAKKLMKNIKLKMEN